mmetsp:Transcript_17608/g.36479  ORF Transcript_17608/g.36479 Transcript_17608/m.36479 type:complete len:313 (-) Transcript_17608:5140-6078(-)
MSTVDLFHFLFDFLLGGPDLFHLLCNFDLLLGSLRLQLSKKRHLLCRHFIPKHFYLKFMLGLQLRQQCILICDVTHDDITQGDSILNSLRLTCNQGVLQLLKFQCRIRILCSKLSLNNFITLVTPIRFCLRLASFPPCGKFIPEGALSLGLVALQAVLQGKHVLAIVCFHLDEMGIVITVTHGGGINRVTLLVLLQLHLLRILLLLRGLKLIQSHLRLIVEVLNGSFDVPLSTPLLNYHQYLLLLESLKLSQKLLSLPGVLLLHLGLELEELLLVKGLEQRKFLLSPLPPHWPNINFAHILQLRFLSFKVSL